MIHAQELLANLSATQTASLAAAVRVSDEVAFTGPGEQIVEVSGQATGAMATLSNPASDDAGLKRAAQRFAPSPAQNGSGVGRTVLPYLRDTGMLSMATFLGLSATGCDERYAPLMGAVATLGGGLVGMVVLWHVFMWAVERGGDKDFERSLRYYDGDTQSWMVALHDIDKRQLRERHLSVRASKLARRAVEGAKMVWLRLSQKSATATTNNKG